MIMQTVNENTRVTLDGRSSYSANGGMITSVSMDTIT